MATDGGATAATGASPAAPTDVLAVLADLQSQVDALTRAVASQQEALDRLLAERDGTSAKGA